MARSLVTWVGLALTLTPTLALILTPRLTPRLVLVGVRSTTASSTTALTTPTTLTSTRAASPASSASLPVHGVDITPVIWVGIFSLLREILLGQQGLITMLTRLQ